MQPGILNTVDQALAVLEHLARCPEPQTLTRLAQEHGTSKARMHRILTTLRGRGFVWQEEDTARYRFGSTCAMLTESAHVGTSVTEACLPALRALWSATQETVLLAVYHDGRAVVVEKTDSNRPVIARPELGLTIPLHAVSAGKVLLAGRSDEEVERVIAKGLQRFTPGTNADPDELRTEIEEIRRAGFAVNREGYKAGVCGVAAPVRRSTDGETVAAIAVCLPDIRFAASFEFLRKSVIAAARDASLALGASAGSSARVAA